MSSPPSSPLIDSVTISEEIAPLPSFKASGVATVDFDGVLSSPLKVHEDVRSGCGGQTWPAGMLLGKHMLRYHKDRLADARIWRRSHRSCRRLRMPASEPVASDRPAGDV
ncbi:hypothetical protein LB505_009995 [Fusarium chuoi]|nr:hypothetical protein LB505_009995 [Fusarium chuoi]